MNQELGFHLSNTKPGKRSNSILALLLSILVVLSGLLAYSLGNLVNEKSSARLEFAGKTLFLSNNTLIQGLYNPVSSTIQANLSSPDFYYLSPLNQVMYLMSGEGSPVFLMNTTTDRISSTLPDTVGSVCIAFDTRDNISYIPIGNVAIALDRGNNIIKNVSLPLTTYKLMYDHYNNEFYAVGAINLTTNNYRIYALSDSFKILKMIYIGAGTQNMVYDSFNHYVYCVNSFSDSVTVISPSDTIVTNVSVGFFPVQLAADPYNGWVYVANTGEDNVSVKGNNFKASSYRFRGAGIPNSVAFDTNLGLAAIGYSSGDMVILNGTNSIGTMRIGQNPYDAVFDSSNGQIYVGCASPATVSILQLILNKSQYTVTAYSETWFLTSLSIVDVAVILWLRFLRKTPPAA